MKLSEYLHHEKLTAREFADLIGVTSEAVRLYLAGRRVPRPKQMAAIFDATGGKVRPNDFFDQAAA